jgi:hypothetical protein
MISDSLWIALRFDGGSGFSYDFSVGSLFLPQEIRIIRNKKWEIKNKK